MTREEFDEAWDRKDEKVQAKWGKQTRTERAVSAGHRHSQDVKLHPLYGVSEEEAEQALAALEKGSLKLST